MSVIKNFQFFVVEKWKIASDKGGSEILLIIVTKEHFYHVGGREEQRNSMVEALVTNFNATRVPTVKQSSEQQLLLEQV